jgi:hypothetical protein
MRIIKIKGSILLSGFTVVILLASGFIPVSVFLFHSVAAQEKAAVQPAPDKPTAESCLGCHGSFEELAKRTAGYVTDQGEKANPHMYVPHDSKKITSCDNCHDAHPVPLTSPEKIAKANVQYCYSACHHENDFTPCIECHKDKK